MSVEPVVSVIMPNYNGARFVKEAIESVLKQTFSDFELVVIDDCSKDESPEIIRGIAHRDSRIRLIESEQNRGVAETRNEGIRQARGKYIALLDNDDIWTPDKLERQMALAEKGADIVYCSYAFMDEQGTEIKKPFVVPEKTDFQAMLAVSVISCSTALIKAPLLKEHLFQPEYYHEDYVLWMELLKIPCVARGDKKVLAYYRQVSGSRSNKKWNAAKERWNTYRKALGMGVITSAWAFARYAVCAVLKYYF